MVKIAAQNRGVERRSCVSSSKWRKMRLRIVGVDAWFVIFEEMAEIAGQGRKAERWVHFIRNNGGKCGLNLWGKAQGFILFAV